MIFYDFKVGLSQKECIEQLRSTFGNDSPSQRTVYQWLSEFKRGRSDLSDEKHEGCPSSAVNDKNIKAARRLIIANNRIAYKEMNSSLGVSMNAIQKILGFRKLCARWIPHRLTEKQKNVRVSWRVQMQQRFYFGNSKAVLDIIIGDETWIYCYEPESKCQSAKWKYTVDHFLRKEYQKEQFIIS